MGTLFGWLGASALVIGIASAPIATQARAVGRPEQAPVHLDSARCEVLSHQFERAAAGHPIGSREREIAARGINLCRAGNFTAGADVLENAVHLIGLTPATPARLNGRV